MTPWNAPDFIEVKMDAEISSYQEEYDPIRDPRFARTPEPLAVSAASATASHPTVS